MRNHGCLDAIDTCSLEHVVGGGVGIAAGDRFRLVKRLTAVAHFSPGAFAADAKLAGATAKQAYWDLAHAGG